MPEIGFEPIHEGLEPSVLTIELLRLGPLWTAGRHRIICTRGQVSLSSGPDSFS